MALPQLVAEEREDEERGGGDKCMALVRVLASGQFGDVVVGDEFIVASLLVFIGRAQARLVGRDQGWRVVFVGLSLYGQFRELDLLGAVLILVFAVGFDALGVEDPVLDVVGLVVLPQVVQLFFLADLLDGLVVAGCQQHVRLDLVVVSVE